MVVSKRLIMTDLVFFKCYVRRNIILYLDNIKLKDSLESHFLKSSDNKRFIYNL